MNEFHIDTGKAPVGDRVKARSREERNSNSGCFAVVGFLVMASAVIVLVALAVVFRDTLQQNVVPISLVAIVVLLCVIAIRVKA